MRFLTFLTWRFLVVYVLLLPLPIIEVNLILGPTNAFFFDIVMVLKAVCYITLLLGKFFSQGMLSFMSMSFLFVLLTVTVGSKLIVVSLELLLFMMQVFQIWQLTSLLWPDPQDSLTHQLIFRTIIFISYNHEGIFSFIVLLYPILFLILFVLSFLITSSTTLVGVS
jgi:hypothetical protein